MAKNIKVLCDFCESKLTPGASFCERCGRPTRWATHEERTTWEVWQWRRSERARAAHPASVPQRRRIAVAASGGDAATSDRSGRGSAAIAVAIAPAPERVLVAVPALKTAAPAAPSPEAVGAPSSELSSAEATTLAMRMLTQRVAQLDGELRRLRGEVAGQPRRRFFRR